MVLSLELVQGGAGAWKLGLYRKIKGVDNRGLFQIGGRVATGEKRGVSWGLGGEKGER